MKLQLENLITDVLEDSSMRHFLLEGKDELDMQNYLNYSVLYKDSSWKVYIPRSDEALILISKAGKKDAQWSKDIKDYPERYGNVYIIFNLTETKKYLFYFHEFMLINDDNSNITDFNPFPKGVLNTIIQAESKNKDHYAQLNLARLLGFLMSDKVYTTDAVASTSIKVYKDFDKLSIPNSLKKEIFAPNRIIYNPDKIKKALKFNRNLAKSIYKNGEKNETILNAACLHNNLELVKLLLTNGASPIVNTMNSYGVTPLHSAVYVNNPDIVKLLLRSGATKSLSTKELDNDRTPLIIAAQKNNTILVKMLLLAGSGNAKIINEKDTEGNTALYYALNNKNKEIVQLLTKYKANPEIDEKTKTAYDSLMNEPEETVEEPAEEPEA